MILMLFTFVYFSYEFSRPAPRFTERHVMQLQQSGEHCGCHCAACCSWSRCSFQSAEFSWCRTPTAAFARLIS